MAPTFWGCFPRDSWHIYRLGYYCHYIIAWGFSYFTTLILCWVWSDCRTIFPSQILAFSSSSADWIGTVPKRTTLWSSSFEMTLTERTFQEQIAQKRKRRMAQIIIVLEGELARVAWKHSWLVCVDLERIVRQILDLLCALPRYTSAQFHFRRMKVKISLTDQHRWFLSFFLNFSIFLLHRDFEAISEEQYHGRTQDKKTKRKFDINLIL